VSFAQPLTDSLSIPIAVVVADRLDSLPGSFVIISPAMPTGPSLVHRHVTEVHAGIRYQVPSFPKPRQKECCCGGR
jgi:hypothetical protein